MSQAINITVNDGQSTPVAHTFYPVQNKQGDGFTFYDQVLGNPVYEVKIWGKLSLGAPGGKASESQLGVIQPITKMVDGVLTQDHVNTGTCRFSFAPNATAAERNDVYAYMINALNQALLKEQTRDLKAWY